LDSCQLVSRQLLVDRISFLLAMQGYEGCERVLSELALARRSLNLASGDPLPIGVGYIAWLLERDPPLGETLLEIALAEKVQAVWFAFGRDIKRWVKFVHDFDAARSIPHKTLVFTQVTSVEEAQSAVLDWKTDILVVQGIGARLNFKLED
jgi:nitronate monooxygenase